MRVAFGNVAGRVTCCFGLFVVIIAASIWWSPGATAQETEVTIETTDTGEVVFRWRGADQDANLHGSAAAVAGCAVFDDGDGNAFANSFAGVATCSAPVAGEPLCLE